MGRRRLLPLGKLIGNIAHNIVDLLDNGHILLQCSAVRFANRSSALTKHHQRAPSGGWYIAMKMALWLGGVIAIGCGGDLVKRIRCYIKDIVRNKCDFG